jgi:hypothetical protein
MKEEWDNRNDNFVLPLDKHVELGRDEMSIVAVKIRRRFFEIRKAGLKVKTDTNNMTFKNIE